MMQIPNLPNCKPVAQQQPSYNAVKIDIHNPMVNVPTGQIPAVEPQYEKTTAPIYEYPKAETQPYYMPPQITAPEVSAQSQTPVVVPPAVNPQPEQTVAREIPLNPEKIPPAPVVTEAPKSEEKKNEQVKDEVREEAPAAAEKPVEVVEPEEIKPQVDINEFIAKLTNPDYDVQAAAMEQIADMVDNDKEKASDLLDTKVVDALNDIIKADTTALEGPSAEVQAQRKSINESQMAKEEKAAALEATITPKEKAERNKSYAIFTAAILQKLYGDEVKRLKNMTVPLTELPGAITMVEQLKGNPNPTVRASAIEALSYIQDPSYKKDLKTVFEIAQNDQDENVRAAATEALDKLNKIADEVALNPENKEQIEKTKQAA